MTTTTIISTFQEVMDYGNFKDVVIWCGVGFLFLGIVLMIWEIIKPIRKMWRQ